MTEQIEVDTDGYDGADIQISGVHSVDCISENPFLTYELLAKWEAESKTLRYRIKLWLWWKPRWWLVAKLEWLARKVDT